MIEDSVAEHHKEYSNVRFTSSLADIFCRSQR
jgi:hypothetical protein